MCTGRVMTSGNWSLGTLKMALTCNEPTPSSEISCHAASKYLILTAQQPTELSGLMRLIIHGGANTIGGNCVEIAAGNTRIILDVGIPLDDPAKLKFGEPLARRPKPGFPSDNPDLPRVPGLFQEGPRVDAIFLSHAHADHTGLLAYANPAIPVHCSRGTSKMLMAGSMFAGQTKLRRERQRTIVAQEPVTVGNLTVTAFAVDHSAFDSQAFIVEGEGKRLLYSGDLRLHGRKPGMIHEILKATAARPIDVLLMEGTHFSEGRSRGPTEIELECALAGHIYNAPGLVLANFSPMHVDRMVSFYKATRDRDRKPGREFVVDPYGALVLYLVASQCHIPRPASCNHIRVYYNQRFLKTWKRDNLQKVHDQFLANRIELSTILAEPQKFIMLFRPSMTERDFQNWFPPQTRCIYSYWSGYLHQPAYQDLRKRLAAVQGDFVQCHTSGHIFAEDLIELVNALKPRLIVPIHTTSPDYFTAHFKNARLLMDDEAIEVF